MTNRVLFIFSFFPYFCLALSFDSNSKNPSLEVDAVLMLAADVSPSIKDDEKNLQRKGYVDAFLDEKVLEVISRGYYGRIAVSYVEWSKDSQYIVPWTLIDMKRDPDSAREFSEKINMGLDKAEYENTSIHQLLQWASYEIQRSRYKAPNPSRYILDISGDGADWNPLSLVTFREQALSTGMTINGLAIDLEEEDKIDVMRYYETCVIGGFRSFVIGVSRWEDFGEAIKRKIIMELVLAPQEKDHAQVFEGGK